MISNRMINIHSLLVSNGKESHSDVSVDLVLKDLASLSLTLWLFRDMCCANKGSLPLPVRQWQG